MISDYFLQIKSIFEKYAYIILGQSITEKTYNDKKGFIEGEVIFHDDSKLDFAEVKDVDKQGKIKYRYHYMDENKDLVFRYDNARHYPDIETFPNHKHTIAGVEKCKEPEIDDVLSEIALIVAKKKK